MAAILAGALAMIGADVAPASAPAPRSAPLVPPIIPAPLSATALPRGLWLRPGAGVAAPRGDPAARAVAAYFIALVSRTGGPRLRLAEAASPRPPRVIFRRSHDPGLAWREAYSLDVGPQGAVITATHAAGLFYGAVTLWQAMGAPTRAGGAIRVGGLRLVDAPRFAWRGLLLDSARHYQSPAFIERLIDWMALHKLNVLQWHLTDDQAWRVQIRRYPRLTRRSGPGDGRFYTQGEIRQLVAYAARRQVTIVPEIEMPGHALSAILAYPRLGLTGGVTAAARGDWGVFPSIFSPDEATFAALRAILTEVMAMFPSRFIHVGGDESAVETWKASPDVQTRMKALGVADEAALHGYFIRRVGAFLAGHGRRLMGWDEILQGGALPPDAAVTSWRSLDGAVAAARSGHDVVMATDPYLYFDHRQGSGAGEPPGRGRLVTLRDVYDYDPGNPPEPPPPVVIAPPAVQAGPGGPAAPTVVFQTPSPPGQAPAAAPRLSLTSEDLGHVLGLQAEMWTEHVRTEARLEAMAFPRAAAVAEAGWTAEQNRSWPGFVARLPALFSLYRRLGLQADQSALSVDLAAPPQVVESARGERIRVALANQTRSGEIRFTTDGQAPTPESSLYQGPIDLPAPSRLRAAAFEGGVRISPVFERNLDAAAARHRASQDLQLCTQKLPLNLEAPRTRPGDPPAILVDILNPCWVYPSAELTGVVRLDVGVAALPFNFQLGAARRAIVLRPPATANGELVVRLDGCQGTIVATLPLSASALDAREGALSAPLPATVGPHDLCFQFTARQPDPMWVVAWVQPVTGAPNAAQGAAMRGAAAR
jgi:hexosaminidase